MDKLIQCIPIYDQIDRRFEFLPCPYTSIFVVTKEGDLLKEVLQYIDKMIAVKYWEQQEKKIDGKKNSRK